MRLVSRVIATVGLLAFACGELSLPTRSMAETVWPQKGPNSREALARVGACAETTITKIAGRFDEPLSPTPFKLGEKLDEYGEPIMDQGVHVLYLNGAEQIDSAWNAAVAHSKLGDPVRLCTVWKPKKCPPGDDRGRIYKATNLRTKKTWQMSESWHSCGGA